MARVVAIVYAPPVSPAVVKGIKMQVYVGVGGDPLWPMGPAFMGEQQDNQRSAKTAAKPLKGTGRRARDMSSSWETIPSPKMGRAYRATTLTVPAEPVGFAGNTPPPNGILAQLIRWLSS